MTAYSMDEGLRNLKELTAAFNKKQSSWNEAETRFQFIDSFLTDCLGWDKSEIHVEQRLENSYTDYELGEPRAAILEAKREGDPAHQLRTRR